MGGLTGTGSELVIAFMLASGGVPGQQAVPTPVAEKSATADQNAPVAAAPVETGPVEAGPVEAGPVEAAAAPATAPVAAPTSVTPPVARRPRAKGDPLEGFNRAMYRLNQTFDRAIFRPLAFAYKAVVPKPVRGGLRHFFANIHEPIVFLHDLLQLKPKRAIKTFARFLINSTAGVGGLLDLAKDDGLPHRENGFGNTLARYGVKPGPYVFLPFFGPSTLRDLVASQADGFILPLNIGEPFDRIEYQIPRGLITGLDLRVESDAELKALLNGAADPYATLRSVYLQNRALEVAEVRGEAAPSPLDDPLADPLADPEAKPGDATPPATEPTPPTDTAPAEPAPTATPSAQPVPQDATLAFVAHSDWRI